MTLSSDNLKGAAFMSICMAAFAFNDALMKLVASDYSLFQVIFLRGIFATAMLAILAWSQKCMFYKMSRSDTKMLLLRFIGELGGSYCFLNALFHMPLANASAILQALPLAITLAASVFLKEAVGWRRYLAIFIGFIGVIIIIRPGSDGFNVYSYYALAAVAFITLRDLSTRRFSTGIPSMFVSFSTSFVVTLTFGLMTQTTVWSPVSTNHLLILLVAAIFLIFAYLTSVMTMRIGDISFVSPFRYTILIWAILLGVVVFGDIPDIWTLLGTAIVVAMGIFTFYREQKATRSVE